MYMFSIKVCLYVITLQKQVCIHSDQHFLFCAKFAFRICQLCHISGKTEIYVFFRPSDWVQMMTVFTSQLGHMNANPHIMNTLLCNNVSPTWVYLDTCILPNFACLSVYLSIWTVYRTELTSKKYKNTKKRKIPINSQ